jgi:DNA polymerase III epsilon subunit family exonuclease
MVSRTNLRSESLLVMETVDYLVSVGGKASASAVVEYVMNIHNANDSMARILMRDIVDRDNRLFIDEDTIELKEPDHDSKMLWEPDYVVFDFETTGAKAPPCRIMEIGAFRVRNGEIVGEYNTLVNPEMPVPEFISSLTGITNSMVESAPKFGEVINDLLDFIGDSVLVAHNAPFDIAFLNHEIDRVHQDARIANLWLCTVLISRRVLPDVENHKLKTLANYYSVDLINHHRACDDARATANIFIRLMNNMSEHGIQHLGSAKKFSQEKIYVRPRKAAA